jgi:ribosomal-protein-alanine N-acetyltransferase
LQPVPVQAGDAAALAALHGEAFPPGESWGPDAITLMMELSGGFGFQVPGAGFILARAVAGEAEILTLAVAPAARRRGVAAALLDHMLAEAAKQGATEVFLEVSHDNIAARGLYARTGFAQAGLRRHYYTDGSDALVLRRDLSVA